MGELFIDRTKPIDINQLMMKCQVGGVSPGDIRLFYEPCSDCNIDIKHSSIDSETRQIEFQNLPSEFLAKNGVILNVSFEAIKTEEY